MMLTGFCLGCITTIFLSVLRDYRQFLVGKLFLGLLVAASAFLVHDYLPDHWKWMAGDLMTTLPALFWGICILGFSESPSKQRVLLPVAIYSFLAPALGRPLGAEDHTSGLLHAVFWQTPQYFEYVVICGGVYAVLSGWNGDLVEGRRRLRAYMLCVLGATSLVVTVSLNFGLGDEVPLVVVALCSLLCSYLMLFTRKELLMQGVSASNRLEMNQSAQPNLHLVMPSEVESEQTVLAKSLSELMALGYYRQETLTLRSLARKLDTPEYRLRKLINERLGYRNFSDYINQLRIEEACSSLLREPDAPIQNIAMDVGYRTMSSFNRAFKDIQRCTPTQFRVNNLDHGSESVGDQVHSNRIKALSNYYNKNKDL